MSYTNNETIHLFTKTWNASDTGAARQTLINQTLHHVCKNDILKYLVRHSTCLMLFTAYRNCVLVSINMLTFYRQ